MQVLKLLKEHFIKLSLALGKELGAGADGQIYEIINDPHKVIKLSIIYDYSWAPIFKSYKEIKSVLDFLKKNIEPAYARVYAHEKLLFNFRKTIDGLQEYIIYYYTMDKLNKISEDEKKVFHSILSHEDAGFNKNYSLLKIKKITEGLASALDFDAEKVILFAGNLRNSPILHEDIHPRNIMKDDNGNFKLIDFDRCKLKDNL